MPERNSETDHVETGDEADGKARFVRSGGVSEALPPDKRLQLAWQLFQSLEYQIQVADRKVQAVFGVNTLLVAALSFQTQNSLSTMRSNGLTTADLLTLGLKLTFLACVLLATGAAIMALRPRVVPPKMSQASDLLSTPRRKTLLFFGDIATHSPAEFAEAFSDLSMEEATQQTLKQSHAVAAILSEKYRQMNRAVVALGVALSLWAILQIVRFIS